MKAEFEDQRARNRGKKYTPKALFDIKNTAWGHDIKVNWVD